MELRLCGPVVDAAAAERARERLGDGAAFDAAWPALAPVFAASPYLAGLATADPARLARLLRGDPDRTLAVVLAGAQAAAGLPPDAAGVRLRQLKAELHLLTGLSDVGGLWDLEQVTGALSDFADAAVAAALASLAAQARVAGRLAPGDGAPEGLFCLALGKHGARELNYSSDIDVSVFYDPQRLRALDGDPHTLAVRLTRDLASLLQTRTADGYVFRVDLRLRPDPASTPVAMPVEAALTYYETAGQNWERAATIKARPCAGDLALAGGFLAALRPFVWRRSLDYAAIADIGSIKRQIHVHKVDERLVAPGHNLKLGAGGIREIEFFVQTQQLILGGRDAALRSPRTLDALAALAERGHVAPDAARDLAEAYVRLRGWEHRVQMLADEQTHVLPHDEQARKAVAALAGFSDVHRFDRVVSQTLETVNARYAALFAEDEDLSTPAGSLVFTGVDDDPETLNTLARMGFSEPARVAATIRAWHHGRIAATRSERARELFTRLAPRLLEAAAASGQPDIAFGRFGDFFSALAAGVQPMSLFLAKPDLLALLVATLAFAPELAATLARQPGALDALLDVRFFSAFDPAEVGTALAQAVGRTASFEAAMDAARRVHREQAFRIGVQVLGGAADAATAGQGFAALADACLVAMADAALAETERVGGVFPGAVAVIALGRAGSREMTARSDLDLMTLYAADDPAAVSADKGWGAETFYARFTQRLTTALSAPTAEGGLYEVDLQLRPSGKAGPVAVSLKAFEAYYAGEAETWEALALTRARVAWASTPEIGAAATEAIVAALRRPRDARTVARDVLDMRFLMRRERPASGPWDLKLADGGLVDIEFAVQALQIVHAATGGPLLTSTTGALAAMAEEGLADEGNLKILAEAFALQSDILQVLKLALPESVNVDTEPRGLKALLSRAGGEQTFTDLKTRLATLQSAAHQAYEAIVRNLYQGSAATIAS